MDRTQQPGHETESARPVRFPWVETLIVTLAVGITAAVVSLRQADAVSADQVRDFCDRLGEHLSAVESFYRDTGTYPPATPSGDVPTGLENYVEVSAWTAPTPIGGRWDVVFEELGVRSAVGVAFGLAASVPDVAVLGAIDRELDDGVLQTGRVRLLDRAGLYFVVMP